MSRHLAGHEPGADLREAAEALGLLSRLLAMKAARVTEGEAQPDDAEEPVDESAAGRRLAEYRLFRAAMEALLLEPAETGQRSFLSLFSPTSSRSSGSGSPPTASPPPFARCFSGSRIELPSRWGW